MGFWQLANKATDVDVRKRPVCKNIGTNTITHVSTVEKYSGSFDPMENSDVFSQFLLQHTLNNPDNIFCIYGKESSICCLQLFLNIPITTDYLKKCNRFMFQRSGTLALPIDATLNCTETPHRHSLIHKIRFSE